MTGPEPRGQNVRGFPLDQAWKLITQAEEWGHLDPMQVVELEVAGGSPSRAQAQCLAYSQALALVSIAESLQDVARWARSQTGARMGDGDDGRD